MSEARGIEVPDTRRAAGLAGQRSGQSVSVGGLPRPQVSAAQAVQAARSLTSSANCWNRTLIGPRPGAIIKFDDGLGSLQGAILFVRSASFHLRQSRGFGQCSANERHSQLPYGFASGALWSSVAP